MAELSEINDKFDKLSREVLLLSRNTLLVNLRFLDSALSQFEYVSQDEFTLLTDGKHLFYNPRHVLKAYRTEKEAVTRDYLHIVLHCVFRHMYGVLNMNRAIWDVACDIAVEAAITDLGLKAVTAKRENAQSVILRSLQKETGKLTAERIYYYYLNKRLDALEIEQLRSIFGADDHELWYWGIPIIEIQKKPKKPAELSGLGSSSEGYVRKTLIPGDYRYQEDRNEAVSNRVNQLQEQIWKEISERMQIELETFQKKRGDVPGNMLQNLNAINREKYDYADFLRKFAVRGEVMEINDEEFDYIYYSYGLKLYEKMPLIEPLEYKEVKRIKEFVIVIDTSGSVMGEEVQTFIQKTYNILKSTESFFSRINLHIIQCDADIREHVKITTQDEFDAWIKTMKIKGLGGTDFRPAFVKVNELIEQREFFNLKGLIYFTDGYGVFPEHKPEYETAFVFVNNECENPEVPPWAMKMVFQKEEL